MKILFLTLVFGLVSADSSFQEIHSSPKKCYEVCKTKYPMTEGDESKCSACCTGCRFESIIGLVSVDNSVQRDGSQKACYETCEEAQLGEYSPQCREGCDQQLKNAEEELVNFDFDKKLSEMSGIMSPLMNMFGNLFGGSSGSNPFAGLTGQSEPEKQPALEAGQKPETVETELQEVSLEQLLKEMGILVVDDKPTDKNQASDSVVVPVNTLPKQPFVLRDISEDESDGEHVTYLKGLWRDRNTVQILLISSITACLFAILWMLCNSSNDPVVNRAQRKTAEEPPSYNVLYGIDEKKLPILVVAGVEEQAPALPEKEKDVPLGFSTKI